MSSHAHIAHCAQRAGWPPATPQFRKKAEWEPKKTVGLEDMVLVSKITDDNIVDNIKKRYNEDLIYVRRGLDRAPGGRPAWS